MATPIRLSNSNLGFGTGEDQQCVFYMGRLERYLITALRACDGVNINSHISLDRYFLVVMNRSGLLAAT